ncbi:efflux RND transporter permease subunit [Foetidibacter luteolus]|uniref:efflux RND transporter permease subunit n=1 Tax=Foetidibacter luteolus TaxID=2608880 RepID=UPI00129B4FA7|nr:MMPL family transporter [Foetidibacter luteolus]
MWYSLGRFILRYRLPLLFALIIITAFMAFKAAKVQLSYEFARTIPTDNAKYIAYQDFKAKFGDDGGTLVAGIQAKDLYTVEKFNKYAQLHKDLKTVKGVEEILSIPEAVTLVKDDSTEKLLPKRIFNYPYTSQQSLDSAKAEFENLPFYNGRLYNLKTNTYLMAVRVNRDMANSKYRTILIDDIAREVKKFEQGTGLQVHLSGLPYIRTTVSDKIKKELNWFLIGSLVLSAITLLIFFRSISAMIMSLLVVGMGVVWSVATIVLFDYKISLLTALIPPLIVVIGIPNCIYFLNKYHSTYKETGDKEKALVTMIGRMGIVTLFCNIAAAIGFAVFSFTRSAILKEFGVVSGINIMALFFISLIFIPVCLSYLPPPKKRHVKYLDSKIIHLLLAKIERWAFLHSKWVYGISALITVVAIIGMFRIKSEGFVVDDLPKTDKIYTDLKWFEENFDGVMPLEIVVDTKRKNGLLKSLQPIERIDEFSKYIADRPETAAPLSFVEGLKFAKQAYYDGDSVNYVTPTEFDVPLMKNYLKGGGTDNDSSTSAATKNTTFSKLLNTFMDSSKQMARISVNMKDIGSAKLPGLLSDFEKEANKIFDSSKYNITFTGGSVTFLEGSSFIINGLKESIMWAFLLITLCMLYLFRSFRILLCSLIPNLIPLVVTAGVMGWVGIALKPSTVLVFSVALGIAIDVTIRFLVNYKQELPMHSNHVKHTLIQTIHHTGLSIIYTSLVLIAGFIIFCISEFGGTKALGWLTSLTLVTGTITNLVLLPVLIYSLAKKTASGKE